MTPERLAEIRAFVTTYYPLRSPLVVDSSAGPVEFADETSDAIRDLLAEVIRLTDCLAYLDRMLNQHCAQEPRGDA